MSLLNSLCLKARVVGFKKFRVGRFGEGEEASGKRFVIIGNSFDQAVIESARQVHHGPDIFSIHY